MVFVEPVKSVIRQLYINNVISKVEDIGNSVSDVQIEVPDTDLLSIVGEDEDDNGEFSELLNDILKYQNGQSSLTCLGILEIKDLEIKEPIWDSCSKTALRFGVGRYPLSGRIGDTGNVAILGHRNRHISTIFYRLQSIKIGTEVIIVTTDGTEHRYFVVNTKNVSPDKLSGYLNDNSDSEEQLTLVTCASELGKGWRFLAICKKGR